MRRRSVQCAAHRASLTRAAHPSRPRASCTAAAKTWPGRIHCWSISRPRRVRPRRGYVGRRTTAERRRCVSSSRATFLHRQVTDHGEHQLMQLTSPDSSNPASQTLLGATTERPVVGLGRTSPGVRFDVNHRLAAGARQSRKLRHAAARLERCNCSRRTLHTTVQEGDGCPHGATRKSGRMGGTAKGHLVQRKSTRLAD